MQTLPLIIAFVSLSLLAGWMFWLYMLTQSKKNRKVSFYSVLFIPIIIPIILNLIIGGNAIINFMVSGIFGLIIAILTIVYFVMWAETLYSVGGDDRRWWFVLIFLISPLWIVYKLGEIA